MVYLTKNQRQQPPSLDFYLPLIFTLLSVLGSSVILLTYFKFARLRVNSGKLVIKICAFELILAFTQLLSYFYTDPTVPKPHWYPFPLLPIETNAYSCVVMSLVRNYAICSYLIYNFCLCHNLYVCIKDPQAAKLAKRFTIYDITSVVLSVAFCTAACLEKGHGMFFGMCTLAEDSSTQLMYVVPAILLFPLVLYSIAYVIHHRSTSNIQDSFATKAKSEFLLVNVLYLLVFLVTWMPAIILRNIMMMELEFDKSLLDSSTFSSLKKISYQLISCTAFFMFLVRMIESSVRSKVKSLILFEKQRKGPHLSKLLSNREPSNTVWNLPQVRDITVSETEPIDPSDPSSFPRNPSESKGPYLPPSSRDRSFSANDLGFSLRIMANDPCLRNDSVCSSVISINSLRVCMQDKTFQEAAKILIGVNFLLHQDEEEVQIKQSTINTSTTSKGSFSDPSSPLRARISLTRRNRDAEAFAGESIHQFTIPAFRKRYCKGASTKKGLEKDTKVFAKQNFKLDPFWNEMEQHKGLIRGSSYGSIDGFAKLRDLFKVKGEKLIKSMDLEDNIESIRSYCERSENKALEGMRLFSHCKDFCLRVISEQEAQSIRKGFIVNYYAKVASSGGSTFLEQMLGLYSFKFEDDKNVWVLLTSNPYSAVLKSVGQDGRSDCQVYKFKDDAMYQLESVERIGLMGERVLEDQDSFGKLDDKDVVQMKKGSKKAFTKVLTQDVKLLIECGLSSYFLVLAIKKGEAEAAEDDFTAFISVGSFCAERDKGKKVSVFSLGDPEVYGNNFIDLVNDALK